MHRSARGDEKQWGKTYNEQEALVIDIFLLFVHILLRVVDTLL